MWFFCVSSVDVTGNPSICYRSVLSIKAEVKLLKKTKKARLFTHDSQVSLLIEFYHVPF